MIDKMSIGHSRPVGGPSIGAGHFDVIRSPDKAGKTSSASGSLTGAIDHMVQQGMPIDMQQITAIRRAIADGQYPVDPAAIADGMIEFDRAGSQSGSGF